MDNMQIKVRDLRQKMHAMFEDLPSDDPEVIRIAYQLADWTTVNQMKYLDVLEGFINAVFQASLRDTLDVIKESSEQTNEMIKSSDRRALRKLVEFIRRETILEIIAMLESESEKKLKRPDVRATDHVRTDSPMSVKLKHMEAQVERLGNCILKHFSHEIGMGDPVHGEGACEVAVRLLERYADTLAEKKEARVTKTRG